jgi:hypothetical protein
MDASGGNNHPVRRISQRTTQCGDFLGDVPGEGKDLKGRICVQLMEQVIQASDDPLASLGEQCHFEQADGADSDALSVPDSLIQGTALLPGQLFGVREPADYNMGVKQESRIQEGESSIPPERIPELRVIDMHDIAGDFDLSG